MRHRTAAKFEFQGPGRRQIVAQLNVGRITSDAGAILFAIAYLIAASASAQPLNVDFGDPGHQPSATYAAAGLAGTWNSIPGLHGTTTDGLVDVEGQPTSVSLLQIGGLETLTAADPDTSGDDALLMDDYLVTYDSGLESCVFLDGVEPGRYEVLIYARMPAEPTVGSDTFVDQEPGMPHSTVGGPWPGDHQELVTFSRHVAIVGPGGDLDFHSGISQGADPSLGAALNGFQIRPLDVFADGFESGDLLSWSSAVGL